MFDFDELDASEAPSPQPERGATMAEEGCSQRPADGKEESESTPTDVPEQSGAGGGTSAPGEALAEGPAGDTRGMQGREQTRCPFQGCHTCVFFNRPVDDLSPKSRDNEEMASCLQCGHVSHLNCFAHTELWTPPELCGVCALGGDEQNVCKVCHGELMGSDDEFKCSVCGKRVHGRCNGRMSNACWDCNRQPPLSTAKGCGACQDKEKIWVTAGKVICHCGELCAKLTVIPSGHVPSAAYPWIQGGPKGRHLRRQKELAADSRPQDLATPADIEHGADSQASSSQDPAGSAEAGAGQEEVPPVLPVTQRFARAPGGVAWNERIQAVGLAGHVNRTHQVHFQFVADPVHITDDEMDKIAMDGEPAWAYAAAKTARGRTFYDNKPTFCMHHYGSMMWTGNSRCKSEYGQKCDWTHFDAGFVEILGHVLRYTVVRLIPKYNLRPFIEVATTNSRVAGFHHIRASVAGAKKVGDNSTTDPPFDVRHPCFTHALKVDGPMQPVANPFVSNWLNRLLSAHDTARVGRIALDYGHNPPDYLLAGNVYGTVQTVFNVLRERPEEFAEPRNVEQFDARIAALFQINDADALYEACCLLRCLPVARQLGRNILSYGYEYISATAMLRIVHARCGATTHDPCLNWRVVVMHVLDQPVRGIMERWAGGRRIGHDPEGASSPLHSIIVYTIANLPDPLILTVLRCYLHLRVVVGWTWLVVGHGKSPFKMGLRHTMRDGSLVAKFVEESNGVTRWVGDCLGTAPAFQYSQRFHIAGAIMFSVITFIETEIRHHGFAPGLRDAWPTVDDLLRLGGRHQPGRLTAGPRDGCGDWQRVEEVVPTDKDDAGCGGDFPLYNITLEGLCHITDFLAALPRGSRPRLTNGWQLVVSGARAIAGEGLKVGMDLSGHPHRAALHALEILNDKGIVCKCPLA